MNLQLTYQEEKNGSVKAVFLSSPKASDWLSTMSQWGIAYSALECYPVPASVSDPSPVGLFVIFRHNQAPELSVLATPFQCISKRLYIPINAAITPQVLPHEWEELLLYDRNFYHPRIGLVGFALKDQLNVKQLLVLPDFATFNWKQARPGSTPRPPLSSIQLNVPPVSDLLAGLKSEMDTRPLDEIPGGDKDEESGLKKDLNTLQRFLLKKLLDNKSSKEQQNRNKSGDRSRRNMSRYDNPGGGGGTSPLAGWLGKAGDWLSQRLDDLEKQREKEIQRLLRMLDEDPDQALRYSIPLDGPYKNRGTAPPSSRLGSRTPDFNLGKIGGGSKADFWNLDKHYLSLREKYQKMAKKCLEEGDHRKAAYIYAHLLGDFHTAASALKQGKYYREAAALYKEHLNNLSQAAICLEEGGLILEAIETYKELAQHEKVGDLYSSLEQYDKAKPHYEKAMAAQLKADNYLKASRICQEKLEEPERTQRLLLEGWKTSKQSERCLLQYFEHFQLQAQEEGEDIEQQINWIYQHHVPAHKKRDFVPILITLNRKYQQLPNVGRDIAYTIISEQAVSGKPDLLPKLRNFVDYDPLLPEDTSRFLYKNKEHIPPFKDQTRAIQLDTKVKWKAARALSHSLLVIGVKAKELIIARVNWKGKVQYTGVPLQVPDSTTFHCVEPGTPDTQLMVLSSAPINTAPIAFEGGHYHFDFPHPLSVTFPDWLPKGLVRICQGRSQKPSALVVSENDGHVQCIHYDEKGNVVATYDCVVQKRLLLWEGKKDLKPMFFRDNYFYTYMGSKVLRIAMDGKTEVVSGSEQIQALQMSPASTAKRLVLRKSSYLTGFQPSFQKLDAERSMLRTKIRSTKHIAFLASRNLLIVGETSGEVYDLKYHRIIHRFPSKPSVIAVTPAAGRREFALVHHNGLIEVKEAPPV
ncbi:MAG: hypothetical protein KTR30_35460 [Saprospiraceae bacterium]|nr:hypothetical protein [Saprospiraceae bacterium]